MGDGQETAPNRAWRDIRSVLGSWVFAIVGTIGGAAGAVATFDYVNDANHSLRARALVTGAGTVAGVLFAATILAAIVLVRTPYAQRDEARATLETSHRPLA